MGFFKNLAKSLNPVDHFKQAKKDPWGTVKNTVAAGLDPAGSIVRTGRGQQAMPKNFKQMYDPGGFTDKPPQQVAPNTYQPGPKLQLSPQAQQLYDDMMARSAARMQGGQYQTGTRAAPAAPGKPAIAPGSAPKTPPRATPIAAPTAIPQVAPRAMRDGGKVQRANKHGADAHFENKVFDRKPNGKPC